MEAGLTHDIYDAKWILGLMEKKYDLPVIRQLSQDDLMKKWEEENF